MAATEDLMFDPMEWETISDEAKDLLQKMMERNVDDRLSAK
jgi:serine/threonine protein kinase